MQNVSGSDLASAEGNGKWTRNEKGTPQGGVISPLLANLYLHWFDALFHGPQGPARWAGAKWVRYAQDMVLLAREWTPELTAYVESKLEGTFGLEINREKTRVVDVKKESLDFLGYTFRYDRERKGRRNKTYLNVLPSKKAIAQEREELREMTDVHQSHTPLPELTARLNRQLEGWASYFSYGYPLVGNRLVRSWPLDSALGVAQSTAVSPSARRRRV